MIKGDLSLPDIVQEGKGFHGVALDRVGMEDIEIPLLLGHPHQFTASTLPAKVHFSVSLDDPQSKGIHMSRLFLLLQESFLSNPLSTHSLYTLLKSASQSQEGGAALASLSLSFKYFVERKALRSSHKGWQVYPITLRATLGKEEGEEEEKYREEAMDLEMEVQVTYSSTCPCSAALARSLIQKKFREKFKNQKQVNSEEAAEWLSQEEGICATPHSQRSSAQVRVKVDDLESFPWKKLIDSAELALGTSVQMVVKREDEQEFARLNGQNLMFCEDAARRLYRQLQKNKDLKDFYIKVSHFESLHPYNAVSVVAKEGVEKGYRYFL